MSERSPVMNGGGISSAAGGDISAGAQAQVFVAVSNEQLERFTHAFEGSARRWELVVYPSLFAFIILAAYGFYLVYSLANDVAYMSESIDRNMTQLVSNFEVVSRDMDRISASVDDMSDNMADISGNMGDISSRVSLLNAMSSDMRRMQVSVRDMSHSARYMQGDLRLINHSFGRPMAAISSPIRFVRGLLPY